MPIIQRAYWCSFCDENFKRGRCELFECKYFGGYIGETFICNYGEEKTEVQKMSIVTIRLRPHYKCPRHKEYVTSTACENTNCEYYCGLVEGIDLICSYDD